MKAKNRTPLCCLLGQKLFFLKGCLLRNVLILQKYTKNIAQIKLVSQKSNLTFERSIQDVIVIHY